MQRNQSTLDACSTSISLAAAEPEAASKHKKLAAALSRRLHSLFSLKSRASDPQIDTHLPSNGPWAAPPDACDSRTHSVVRGSSDSELPVLIHVPRMAPSIGSDSPARGCSPPPTWAPGRDPPPIPDLESRGGARALRYAGPAHPGSGVRASTSPEHGSTSLSLAAPHGDFTTAHAGGPLQLPSLHSPYMLLSCLSGDALDHLSAVGLGVDLPPPLTCLVSPQPRPSPLLLPSAAKDALQHHPPQQPPLQQQLLAHLLHPSSPYDGRGLSSGGLCLVETPSSSPRVLHPTAPWDVPGAGNTSPAGGSRPLSPTPPPQPPPQSQLRQQAYRAPELMLSSPARVPVPPAAPPPAQSPAPAAAPAAVRGGSAHSSARGGATGWRSRHGAGPVLQRIDSTLRAAGPSQRVSEAADAPGAVQERATPPRPAPPPAPLPLPAPAHAEPCTHLLALSPGLPASMKRSHWCLEDYAVTRRLYKGSSSAVYKATCQHSGLPVALKIYFLSRVPESVLHMIGREIEIHSEAVHPHIASLYAAFQTDVHLVIVMEYAANGDLFGIHRSVGSHMDEQHVVLLVMAPLVDALAYLHRKGIIHRDIKPENVLFTSNWQLKLADFGVSINLAQERAVTRAGTECYMAPEVARCPLKYRPEDNKNNRALCYSTACDIWALGVLAYELLVGFTPVVPLASGPQAHRSGSDGRDTLFFPASMPEAARDFITKAMAERPEERPTALQLARHPWLRVHGQPRTAGVAGPETPQKAP